MQKNLLEGSGRRAAGGVKGVKGRCKEGDDITRLGATVDEQIS